MGGRTGEGRYATHFLFFINSLNYILNNYSQVTYAKTELLG